MGEDTEQQLTYDIARTRQDLSRDVEALSDKVSPTRVVERRVQRTRYGLTRMKDRVMGTAYHGREAVGSKASQVAGTATDTASGTADAVRQRTEGNPLAAGLIAFGAGWLVSSLLPPTEREKQLAGAVVDTAKERGGPVAQEAASMGQEMGERLKEKASEAVEEVKSTAQQGAERVADEGRTAAETVKEEVRPSSATTTPPTPTPSSTPTTSSTPTQPPPVPPPYPGASEVDRP